VSVTQAFQPVSPHARFSIRKINGALLMQSGASISVSAVWSFPIGQSTTAAAGFDGFTGTH